VRRQELDERVKRLLWEAIEPIVARDDRDGLLVGCYIQMPEQVSIAAFSAGETRI